MTTKHLRIVAVAALAVLSSAAFTACSAPSEGSSGTYTLWDPYPQHDNKSDWAKRIQSCGTEAGVTIKRTAYDSQTLTNQALLSAQEGTLPDILLYDNPGVSTLAATGALADDKAIGLDTADILPNLLAPGVVDGKTYGVPVGANTLALYYNKNILDQAGVDPASITSWDTLTVALKKVIAKGHKGISFAGFASEEGTFQFEPFFWGAGAKLDKLDSPQAISALTLWKGWMDQKLAPNSVITNSQNTTWEEFSTGDVGFDLNGTWQVNSAAQQKFKTGFIPVPGKDGGIAPTPTGGEFMLAPTKKDTARYKVTAKIIECMGSTPGQVKTADTFAYYIPPTKAGQAALLKEHPELQVWVDAVNNARGRTADLGKHYPKVSEQIWTAVQNALSGAMTPTEALQRAQKAAAAAKP